MKLEEKMRIYGFKRHEGSKKIWLHPLKDLPLTIHDYSDGWVNWSFEQNESGNDPIEEFPESIM